MSSFQRLDKNGDGLLNSDEMPQELRDELSTWDKNKDSFIDLEEYKEYFKARMAARQAERGQNQPGGPGAGGTDPGQGDGQWGQTPIVPVEEEAKRPVVYRAGNLPKDIPSWFAEADADRDGQVSLFEWRNNGWSDREFFALDLNGDGFITVEEAMRSQTKLRGNDMAGGMGRQGGPGRGPGGAFGAPNYLSGTGAGFRTPGTMGNNGGRPQGGYGDANGGGVPIMTIPKGGDPSQKSKWGRGSNQGYQP